MVCHCHNSVSLNSEGSCTEFLSKFFLTETASYDEVPSLMFRKYITKRSTHVSIPILLCMMTSIYKAEQAKLELEIYSIEGNYYLPALELLFLRRRSSSQHK
jgi:hypothetical protein